MIIKLLNLYRRKYWNKVKWARQIGVIVGNDCQFFSANFGSEPYLVSIGNHVQITGGVKFFTHGGGWVLREKYPNFDTFGKIKIGNNVYIGNNSLIMPGVSIGNNVVIGAGSIITKSIPDNVVIAGVPAVIVSTLEKYEMNMLQYNTETKSKNFAEKKRILLSLPDNKFIKKSLLR